MTGFNSFGHYCRSGIIILFFCLTLPALLNTVHAGRTNTDDNRIRRKILYDFEDNSQLDSLSWKCGTVYSRSRRFQSSGSWCLKVEMYPEAEWPGFGFGVRDNWEDYDTLSLYVYNPEQYNLTISYRIDDRRDNPPYSDRINGRISLKPGANFLNFNLAQLKTSGTRRHLHREDICCFLLFLHRPPDRITIFLDDIALH